MLVFELQDKAQPETQATTFGNVQFDASLALDNPEALPLVRQTGSDGFTLSSSPLFQVRDSLCFITIVRNPKVPNFHLEY